MRGGRFVAIGLVPLALAIVGLVYPDTQFAVTVIGVSIFAGVILAAFVGLIFEDL
jgi:hypothetical protein